MCWVAASILLLFPTGARTAQQIQIPQIPAFRPAPTAPPALSVPPSVPYPATVFGATPLLPAGAYPPTPPAGPPTTAAAGACGCPHITPIATSEKPGPGRTAFELSADDIDWAFSNRLTRFNGDWDKALLDLAHAIDPGGSLQLWSDPAPVADQSAAPLVEGDLTRFLISGPPDPSTLQPAPFPLPGEDPRVAMGKYLFGAGRISGIVLDLVATIARADKYGEPAFGVRDAALHWARFLADDLSRVPEARARASPAGQRIELVRGQALYTLQSILNLAIRPDPRWSNVIPREGRLHFVRRYPDDTTAGALPSAALALDVYDLASAALDVILAIDNKKQTKGLLGYMGRPTHFDPEGRPIWNSEDAPGGAASLLVQQTLIELAALHSRFGGPAPSGSPAEAVACKALSVLAGLADRKLAHSAALRRNLWAWMILDPAWAYGQFKADPFAAPRYRAIRAAALLAGLDDGEEARLVAPFAIFRLEQRSIYAFSEPPPNPSWSKNDVAGALQTLRDVLTYATGPGRAAFAAVVNTHLDRIRSISALAQAAREPAWPETGAILTFFERLPDTFPPVLEKGTHQRLLGITSAHLAAWDAAQPDISALEWQALCPPKEAPPRVLIFAQGRHDPILLDKLYQNIPLMLGVVFDEPYDGASYPVSLRTSGGQIDLTARRAKENALLFLTDPFVIRGQ